MNIKEVRDAALVTLGALCSGVKRYVETIPQGFERPCFFVKATEAEEPLMNGRVECKLILTICRYPDKKEDAQEVGAEIGDALTVALGSLEIDGRPRRPCRSQYAAKEDDTLEWEAEYRFHVLRKEKGIRMGSLTHHEELH